MTYKVVFSEILDPAPRAFSGKGSQYFIVESTGHLVAMLGRLFARSLNARLVKYGISHGQWPVLVMLWAEDGLHQTEISRRISVEPATMVRTINRMERDGLVTRRRNKVDKRQMIIALTPYGRSLRDKVLPCAKEVNKLAAGNISSKRLRDIHAGLREMIFALRADDF